MIAPTGHHTDRFVGAAAPPAATASAPEAVTKAGALLGEGPMWDAANARLLWVDIWSGLLHSTVIADQPTEKINSQTTTLELGPPLSSVVLTTEGTLVVSAGLCVLELTADGIRHRAHIPEDACMRANDAAVDPAGRLWIGTMTMPHRPPRAGALWRLDPGCDVPVRVLDDVRLANGIAWSPSGDTMYFVDSLRQRLDAYPFDVAIGTLGAPRTVVGIPADEGMPDGIAVDEAGGVWVALAGGAAVRRYDPRGELEEHIVVPTPFPTSCAFGGDLRDLYVTTGSRPIDAQHRAAAVADGAGAVFRIRTTVAGLPTSLMEV